MPKYKIEYKQVWIERGEQVIDAEDHDQANSMASENAITGSMDISWLAQEPDGHISVESVTKAEDDTPAAETIKD